MGFADLMLENPELPESVHKDLRVIIQEAQRTKQIVQNLLSFARQRPRQQKPLDVNDVLTSTLQLRTYEFASHRVVVQTQLADDIPQLNGDAQQLQQVFLNILNNANDAIRETGKPGLIEVSTRKMEAGVEISFRDNGPGISSPDRILDPFYTTKEVGKGTGLGLSICYGIIREHEGELIFSNNLDAPGACFRVWLPFPNENPEVTKNDESAKVSTVQ
jgi:two-component system NtrC family sensor kinase